MYLLVPFILQNFLKNLRVDSDLWGFAPCSGPKWYICHEKIFFGANHCYYFHLLLSPFHCATFKTILTADPELWRCTIFGPKVVHLLQTIFILENYYYGLPYLLATFVVQNLEKKILPVDPESWKCAIFEPKMAHFPKTEFFQKIC